MSLSIQDLIVTVLALGAALIIVQRVIGTFRPSATPHCSNCASGAAACAKPAAENAEGEAKPVPLVLHRR